MNPGVENMKTGGDTLGTVENDSGSANHEIGTRRPSVPSKTSPGENESGSAKHENGT
jgi:hypothetical protein